VSEGGSSGNEEDDDDSGGGEEGDDFDDDEEEVGAGKESGGGGTGLRGTGVAGARPHSGSDAPEEEVDVTAHVMFARLQQAASSAGRKGRPKASPPAGRTAIIGPSH
jgi:hypothetical protein